MSRINKSGIILSLGWLSVILLLSGCGESPGGTVPPVTEPEIIDLSIGVEEVVNLATTPEPRYFRVVANEGENLVITVDPKDEGHDYNIYVVRDFHDDTLDDTFRDDKEKLPNPDNFSSYDASAEHMGDEEEVVGITNAGGKYLITVTAENYNASEGEEYQYGIKVDYGKKYEVNVSKVAGDAWSDDDFIVEVTVIFVDADGQIDNSLNESPIEWYIEGGASPGTAKIKAPGEEYEYPIAAPARAPGETVAVFIGKISRGGNKVWVTFNDWLTIRSMTKIGEHQRVVQVTLSQRDDDGFIEFAVADVTKPDDSKALRNRLLASGWINRGEFYALEDITSIAEKIRWGGEMPEARLSPYDPVTLVKNQADLLYISSHGFSGQNGAIGTTDNKFYPNKQKDKTKKHLEMGDWDEDLEWVVLASCSVLKLTIKEDGTLTPESSDGGMHWAKVLANSKLHGLLGYRGGSLGVGDFLTADDSVTIAQDFIAYLNNNSMYRGYGGDEEKNIAVAWLEANKRHHTYDMNEFDPYNAVAMIKKENRDDNPGFKYWKVTRDRIIPATELQYYWIDKDGNIHCKSFTVLEPTEPTQ